MKRLVTAAMLILVLSVCEPALAADIAGLYVAPKLVWSYQVQDNGNIFTRADATNHFTGAWGDYGTKNKSDNTFGGALAVGYDFMPKFSWPIRAELEYSMRSQTKLKQSGGYGNPADGYSDALVNTRSMRINTLFANVFYDFKTGTRFTPYIGGGIGVADIQVKDRIHDDQVFMYGPFGYTGSVRKTATNFAWNLTAGVAYSFDSNWSLDLGYRYCDFGKVKGGQGLMDHDPGGGGMGAYGFQAKSDVTAHEVALGLRYTF